MILNSEMLYGPGPPDSPERAIMVVGTAKAVEEGGSCHCGA